MGWRLATITNPQQQSKQGGETPNPDQIPAYLCCTACFPFTLRAVLRNPLVRGFAPKMPKSRKERSYNTNSTKRRCVRGGPTPAGVREQQAMLLSLARLPPPQLPLSLQGRQCVLPIGLVSLSSIMLNFVGRISDCTGSYALKHGSLESPSIVL